MLPITEQENPRTSKIDRLDTLDAVRLINAEDALVAPAVEKVLPEIAETVDRIFARLHEGGRLFYIGTGTSGRLGVLDAAELPPTFGVSADLVQGVIAGGFDALVKATEASEDDRGSAVRDLTERGLSAKDAVIGIAASGRTPYTIGGVEYARSLGCFTACLTCNPDSPITLAADIAIVPIVGPEAIAGSTRLKAGTAQKMVLNMISTVLMIRLGYVSGNRMTNLRPSNEKLAERARRVLASETGINENEAAKVLRAAGGDLRVALVMQRASVSADTAREALADSNYVIQSAVANLK